MKVNKYEDILKAQLGDEAARSKVVEANLSLVWSLVHRFSHNNTDKEDLFQIGCLGLLKAIDKFDVSFDVCFSTYAVPIILGELKKHFRDDGSVKVSRGLKELNIKINKVKEEYRLKHNKECTLQDLQDVLKVDKEDILMAMEANHQPISLSDTVYEKNGSTINLEDCLADNTSEKLINLVTLKEEIEKLNKQEKELIYLRYYKDLNQETVAKYFKVSQVQVSRMERKIIEKLRKQFV